MSTPLTIVQIRRAFGPYQVGDVCGFSPAVAGRLVADASATLVKGSAPPPPAPAADEPQASEPASQWLEDPNDPAGSPDVAPAPGILTTSAVMPSEWRGKAPAPPKK